MGSHADRHASPVAEISAYKDIDGDGKTRRRQQQRGRRLAIHIRIRRTRWARGFPCNVSGPGPWGGAWHRRGRHQRRWQAWTSSIAYGWWEQPPGAQRRRRGNTTSRSWPAGRARAAGPAAPRWCVYDVNGDGKNDVVTSLEAHGFGLAWFEQKRDAAGKISFVEHLIMGDYDAKNPGDVTFSELHGVTAADMDGDGIPDIIVGKRYWSHEESYVDPDPYGRARAVHVPDRAQSESARRRGVRARAGPQPLRRGIDDAAPRT